MILQSKINYDCPLASYELWLASPSYDAPSVQLNKRGNHIITSAKHSHNSKLITKKEKNYGRQYFER